MKAHTLLALLTASLGLAAITLLSFHVAVSLLFAVGVVAITVIDYRRKVIPLRVAAIVALPLSERLRLAA